MLLFTMTALALLYSTKYQLAGHDKHICHGVASSPGELIVGDIAAARRVYAVIANILADADGLPQSEKPTAVTAESPDIHVEDLGDRWLIYRQESVEFDGSIIDVNRGITMEISKCDSKVRADRYR